MKPKEEGGVVDSRLNVYGVQNLKIAGQFSRDSPAISIDDKYPFIQDLSVCPGNVAAVSTIR